MNIMLRTTDLSSDVCVDSLSYGLSGLAAEKGALYEVVWWVIIT